MRIFLAVLALLALHGKLDAQACCCTSAGGSYNILPNIDNHVVGLRYSYSNWNSTSFANSMGNMQGMNMADMAMMGSGTPTTENMHTVDAFGRFALPKRIFVSVFLPVHVLDEQSPGSNQHTTGIGDMSLLVQYAVFNTSKCNGHISKHQLRLGAGVKAPTGKFNMTPDGMFTTDLQLGTGSWDFLFNAIYTYRYKQFGFNLLASYKKNLVNSEGFRFGDKARSGLEAFYIFKLPHSVSIMPKVGAHFEYAAYNISDNVRLDYTGGKNLYGDIGFDIYYKNIAFSACVTPTLINWYNWVDEPYENFAVETGIYYSFSKVIKNKKNTQNEHQL